MFYSTARFTFVLTTLSLGHGLSWGHPGFVDALSFLPAEMNSGLDGNQGMSLWEALFGSLSQLEQPEWTEFPEDVGEQGDHDNTQNGDTMDDWAASAATPASTGDLTSRPTFLALGGVTQSEYNFYLSREQNEYVATIDLTDVAPDDMQLTVEQVSSARCVLPFYCGDRIGRKSYRLAVDATKGCPEATSVEDSTSDADLIFRTLDSLGVGGCFPMRISSYLYLPRDVDVNRIGEAVVNDGVLTLKLPIKLATETGKSGVTVPVTVCPNDDIAASTEAKEENEENEEGNSAFMVQT
jgi:hypothetical protein